MNDQHPYALFSHGSGGFVSFDCTGGDVLSLPLLSLTRATLRTRGSRCELVLEFESNQVTLRGTGLAGLSDHLFAARVKMIRTGKFEGCSIESIQVVDA